MKVLITGATGRVGRNVVSRLASQDVAIRAFVRPGSDRRGKSLAFPTVEIFEGNLSDQRSVNEACKGVTHVIHLAAQIAMENHPVDQFYDINAFSTLRLLEGVRRFGDDLQRFVFASTDSTYRPGSPPEIPILETAKQTPSDYYGTSKLLSEIILRNRSEQFNIPFTILRFSSVIRPEEADRMYRLGFIRRWLRNNQELGRQSTLWPLFHGKGDVAELVDKVVGDAPDETAVGLISTEGPWTLSMVDVRDAAESVCLSIREPGAIGRTFNISAARATTSEEGAAAVSDVYGVERIMVDVPFRWQLELNIDKARKLLHYDPVYDYRGTVLSGVNGN